MLVSHFFNSGAFGPGGHGMGEGGAWFQVDEAEGRRGMDDSRGGGGSAITGTRRVSSL